MNLRTLRKKMNITQTELAELVGVKPNAISQYEAGNREPNIETLCKIAAALQVTVDELVAKAAGE